MPLEKCLVHAYVYSYSDLGSDSQAHVLVTGSYLTLCYPMDCSLPGFSVYGISQARILEWVAISFSRGSSRPRDRTHTSCIGSRFFITEPLGKVKMNLNISIQ